MEDVAFLTRLGSLGKTTLLQRPVTTSGRRFRSGGVVRQQLLNGCLLALYHLGADPARLARWYSVSRGRAT